MVSSSFFRNGRETQRVLESRQLIDNISHSFLEIGKNPQELWRLRQEKHLSMRELARTTGHSLSYLRQQLRKYDIGQEKKTTGVQPYGWHWEGGVFKKNANEQGVICEILRLSKGGLGPVAIASELNQKRILARITGAIQGSGGIPVLHPKAVNRRAHQLFIR